MRPRAKLDLRFFFLFSILISLVLAIMGAVDFPRGLREVGFGFLFIVHGTFFYMVHRRTVPWYLRGIFGIKRG